MLTRIDCDRNITVGAFAKWLGMDENSARKVAESCGAIMQEDSNYIDLEKIDKAKGTNYVKLGRYGAESMPGWAKNELSGFTLACLRSH